MDFKWLHIREERDVQFGQLKPGDRFVQPDKYFTLRQVVRNGDYLESIEVGRFAKDRAVITIPEEVPTSTSHGSSEIVHRVVMDLEPLRTSIASISSVEFLDRQLEVFGGGAAPDDFFDVFLREYDRRGWSMPQ